MVDDIIIKKSDLDQLIEQAAEFAAHTKSDSTKRAYQTDFRIFTEWCESHELQFLPAEWETVVLYLVHLDKLGRKPSTIERAVISISQAHKLNGYDNPVDCRVLEFKKGINRIRGTARVKKKALTLDRMRRVIGKIPQTHVGVRDKAILLVGWCGALRRSEICGIDVEHLERVAEGIVVTIPRSKTDQEGVGRKIGLPFINSAPTFCPVTALNEWLDVSKITSGPVFCGLGKGAYKIDAPLKRLDTRTISSIVKRAVKRADLDPSFFSGHSLRSGLATTLAYAGIEERRIMDITGHKSLDQLRSYIQEGSIFRDHPILTLF